MVSRRPSPRRMGMTTTPSSSSASMSRNAWMVRRPPTRCTSPVKSASRVRRSSSAGSEAERRRPGPLREGAPVSAKTRRFGHGACDDPAAGAKVLRPMTTAPRSAMNSGWPCEAPGGRRGRPAAGRGAGGSALGRPLDRRVPGLPRAERRRPGPAARRTYRPDEITAAHPLRPLVSRVESCSAACSGCTGPTCCAPPRRARDGGADGRRGQDQRPRSRRPNRQAPRATSVAATTVRTAASASRKPFLSGSPPM